MIPNYWIIPGIKISTLTLSQRKKLSDVNWTPSLDDIADCVCEHFLITLEQLKSRSRKTELVWPRQIFCYLAMNLTGKPLTEVGDFINRDHTTVIYSRDVCNNEIDTDKISARQVREVGGMVANVNFKSVLNDKNSE